MTALPTELHAVEQQDAADEVRASRWRPSQLILVLDGHTEMHDDASYLDAALVILRWRERREGLESWNAHNAI